MRLLGKEGTFGEALGLKNDWAYNAIKATGNYGEMFERNLGQGSLLKIARGQNALWTNGALKPAAPIRLTRRSRFDSPGNGRGATRPRAFLHWAKRAALVRNPRKPLAIVRGPAE